METNSIEILDKIFEIKNGKEILSPEDKLDIEKLQSKLNKNAINPVSFI